MNDEIDDKIESEKTDTPNEPFRGALTADNAEPVKSIEPTNAAPTLTAVVDYSEPDAVKKQIDAMASAAVIQDTERAKRLIDEKAKELTFDAQAKSTQAKAGYISAQSEQIDQEALKFDKERKKSEAFFNANKAVLNIIGIREPLGHKTMSIFYVIALPLYLLFSIAIAFPIAVVKFFISVVVETIGEISSKVKSAFLKAAAGIAALGLTGGIVTGFVFLAKWIITLL